MGMLSSLPLSLDIMSAVASPSSNSANEACYWAPQQALDPGFVSCGNSTLGDYSCCLNHDVCVSNNACWNSDYGNYLVGCTDPTYLAESCPDKGQYADQQWVGLVPCLMSNDTSETKEEWAGCYEAEEAATLLPDLDTALDCACNLSASTALFTAGPTLSTIDTLSSTTGDGLHTGTSSFAVTSLNALSSALITTSSTPRSALTTHTLAAGSGSAFPTIPSSVMSSASASSLTLSVGARAGIGVGVGVGALVFGVFAVVGTAAYRRHMKKTGDPQQAVDDEEPSSHGMSPKLANTGMAKLDSPAFFGGKSELSAENTCNHTGNQPRRSNEYSVQYQPSQADARQSKGLQQDVHGSVSDISAFRTAKASSPERTTVSSQSHWSLANQPDIRMAHDTIHELPG